MKRILIPGAIVACLAVVACVYAATPSIQETTQVPTKTIEIATEGTQSTDPTTEGAQVESDQTVSPQANAPQPQSPQANDPQTQSPVQGPSDSAQISEKKAKSIALGHAGVSEKDTTFLHVGQEYDDGLHTYNVDFLVGTTEYEYEIDANSGVVIEFDAESIYD